MNHQAVIDRALEGMTFGSGGDGRRPDIKRHAELFRAEQERRAMPEEPRVREPGWWDDAACLGMDPREATAVFFPTATGGRSSRGVDYTAARAICATCPVRRPCLDAALSEERSGARHGMRGGMTAEERGIESRMRRMRR